MTAFDGMLSLEGFLREFIIIIITTGYKFTQKPCLVLVSWSSMYLEFTCTADSAYMQSHRFEYCHIQKAITSHRSD